jgi:Domain of unknown function (DUF5664)
MTTMGIDLNSEALQEQKEKMFTIAELKAAEKLRDAFNSIPCNDDKDYLLEKQIAEPPMFNPVTVTVDEVKIHLNDEKPQTYKADAGKAELSLAPSQIMHYIAIAKKYGNEKYGAPDSWLTVDPTRWIDAMLRHALAFAENPNSVDEESGLPHLFHLDCNCAFLSEFYKRGAFK